MHTSPGPQYELGFKVNKPVGHNDVQFITVISLSRGL